MTVLTDPETSRSLAWLMQAPIFEDLDTRYRILDRLSEIDSLDDLSEDDRFLLAQAEQEMNTNTRTD